MGRDLRNKVNEMNNEQVCEYMGLEVRWMQRCNWCLKVCRESRNFQFHKFNEKRKKPRKRKRERTIRPLSKEGNDIIIVLHFEMLKIDYLYYSFVSAWNALILVNKNVADIVRRWSESAPLEMYSFRLHWHLSQSEEIPQKKTKEQKLFISFVWSIWSIDGSKFFIAEELQMPMSGVGRKSDTIVSSIHKFMFQFGSVWSVFSPLLATQTFRYLLKIGQNYKLSWSASNSTDYESQMVLCLGIISLFFSTVVIFIC